MSARSLRCAIYTRKSSEEGLDQDFNSLHAQREACAAYVVSQRHEGWKLVSKHYDDGGYSGGTLERPALESLLTDIEAGLVDLIVVYKVDRLTRSLHDFAKIVDRLDVHNASFVSITQSFNTTTSMGRLTLNVLLSFAQFEREVTGERIRDKIAASKQKGMWMGGVVPLGYDCIDRTLVINETEAVSVRRIFELYCALGDVQQVRLASATERIVTKHREQRGGKRFGGCGYTNGQLFRLLRNPVYIGKVAHKGQLYAGQHPAILSDAWWEAAQATLNAASNHSARIPRTRIRHPLHRLISDAAGREYYPVFTTKRGKRYRYYVSKDGAGTKEKQARLPAEELEAQVLKRLDTFFASPAELLATLRSNEDCWKTSDLMADSERLRSLAAKDTTDRWRLYRPILDCIVVRPERVEICLVSGELRRLVLGVDAMDKSDLRTASAKPILMIPIRLYRTGHDLRLVVNNGAGPDEATTVDRALVRFVAQGQRWYRQLTTGQMRSVKAIAKIAGLTDSYVSRVVAGSLLAPDILERILEGRQPVGLTVKALRTPPPLDWDEQRRLFGILPR